MLLRSFALTSALIGIVLNLTLLSAQEENNWSSVRTIPGYHPETEPPILISDPSGIVHAFSSQLVGGDDGQHMQAIMYNQWSKVNGWTMPNDILLSPLKLDARLLDAFLDQRGTIHLIFFGGDGRDAQIYYSKAPAIHAGQASVWSKPVMVGPKAHDPQNGGIAGDSKGNLVIIYSGRRNGTGWYETTSTDHGDNWSEETLLFPTYDGFYSPFYLRTYLGESDLLHTVWSVNDSKNHGKAIYYANYNFSTVDWTDPLPIAEQSNDDNLGTMAPTIIEHDGSLFVMYYDGALGHQYFLKSNDGGLTWSEPVAPFSQIGLNGPAYFAVDSNDDLHLFWAQRLPASAQVPKGSFAIHAVWHSVWLGRGWSELETIVSGRRISDLVGFNGFDPNTVHVAVSEGNIVLVTWRNDRSFRGNGVWYSTTVLDAPQLPVAPLPTIQPTLVVDAPEEILVEAPESIMETRPELNDQLDIQDVSASSPTEGLWTGLISVILLILLIGLFRQLSHSRQR